MMACGSTWYLAPKLSNVSVALVVTTMPGTGGMTSCCPGGVLSLAIRVEFDQRIWLTVTPKRAAIVARPSPPPTPYGTRMRLDRAPGGIESGLINGLYPPPPT